MDRHRRLSPESHYRHYAYAEKEGHQAPGRQGRKRAFDLRDTIESAHMGHSYTRPQEGVYHFRGDEGGRSFQKRDISPIRDPHRKKQRFAYQYDEHPLGDEHSERQVQLANSLHEDRHKLGHVDPNNNQKLYDFSDETCFKAGQLMLEAKNYPDSFAASKCRHALINYANCFFKGKNFELSIYWFWMLYVHLFDKMTPTQKQGVKNSLALSLDKATAQLYHSESADIRKHDTPGKLKLLIQICENKECFYMMSVSHQKELMACIYKHAICQFDRSIACKFLNHLSFEDIDKFIKSGLEGLQEKFNVSPAASWVCLILWPAFASLTGRYKMYEIVEFVREVCINRERMDKNQWLSNRRLPQSFHTLMSSTLKFFLMTEQYDDIQQARDVIYDLRTNGSEVYQSTKRFNLTLCNILHEYGNILISHGYLEETRRVLSEIKSIEQCEREEISEHTMALEADMHRLEYEKGDIGKIRDASNIEKYINYFSKIPLSDMYPAVVLCLGKLYMALEKREEAEEVFKYYKGDAGIGYRLRALNLQALGRHKQAENVLEFLETGSFPNIHHIHNEYAICLCDLSDNCHGKDKLSKLEKAIFYFNKAITEGPNSWGKGWVGLGHLLGDIEEMEGGPDFHDWKQSLLSPLSRCKNWSDAATQAFHIGSACQKTP